MHNVVYFLHQQKTEMTCQRQTSAILSYGKGFLVP